MNTSLDPHGTGTFPNEVTNIGAVGFWMLIDGVEYFIPFREYPVFERATIQQIFNFKILSPRQLHWPDLDADVELDALENPEEYPLTYRDN